MNMAIEGDYYHWQFTLVEGHMVMSAKLPGKRIMSLRNGPTVVVLAR